MRTITDIADAVRRDERITPQEALTLWREAPLWLLGELAVARKVKASGREVYYNRNVHLEPTNICLFNCEFCSFRRREGDKDAWYMSLDEVEARAKELRGTDITEVHIVGGVHPKHDLDTYCAMIRRVKGALPHVTVKAYTAVEIFYMIRHEGVSVVEGLRRLMEAGMECIPGGGAEIFDSAIREKICPEKCSADEWLAVHRAAHNMGIATNCTMLYGHIESLEHRVDHLNRLRMLQDEAPGFDAFIPLKYHSRGNRLGQVGECSVEDDLRMIAISRIFLDNIPHIKAYWVSYGKATTEMALAFGADDIDGTIGDTTKIYSMAGGVDRPSMSVDELEAMVVDAGFVPVERDSHYNVVEHDAKQVEQVEQVQAAKVTPEAAISELKAEVVVPAKEEPRLRREKAMRVLYDEPVEEKQAVKSAEVKEKAKENINQDKSMSQGDNAQPQGGSAAKSSKGDNGGSIGRLFRRMPVIANMVVICILGIIALVMLYVGLRFGTRHGQSIEVPNFLGMTIEQARDVANSDDLQIIVRDSIFDVDLPGGMVVDQLPRTSSVREVTVKPGRKIYVTINAYSRRIVDIPYVAKQTLRQALNQIERSGLTVDRLIYEPDMTSTDYVLKQFVGRKEILPATNATGQVGTGVTLRVSYRRDEQHTYTPRLVGLSLQQAKSALWDNGLNVGDVVYDDSVEDMISRRKARVYRQSKSIGAEVRRGGDVTLYLTCDEALADSMSIIAEREARSVEQERMKRRLAQDSLAQETM
ncbi:MAG: CofH family radical SAM protein [Alistipes sp.]|nr:CofH family radical SAM protein [Alistipes sp.]